MICAVANLRDLLQTFFVANLLLFVSKVSVMATESALKGSRGPAFTAFEDLLICKAFIASSEDPTVGAYQKGSTFQLAMHRIYCQFLDDHEKISSSLFEAVPSSTSQLPATFNRRTAKSIYDRFKNVISPRVMKFIAITEVTPRESGKNDHDFFEQCKLLFSQQTTYGDFEPFRKCYEYLEKKPKFASWRGHMNTSTTIKKERPIGSKRAKETEAVKEVARKVMNEQKGSKDDTVLATGDMRMMMHNFNAFMEMRMMKEMGAGLSAEEIEDLDTPDRRAYRKAKASFMIATMNDTLAKRRRLSFTEASSSVSSSGNSVPSVVKPNHSSTGSSNSNESDLEDSVEFTDANQTC